MGSLSIPLKWLAIVIMIMNFADVYDALITLNPFLAFYYYALPAIANCDLTPQHIVRINSP